ncbi:MAG: TetR family transcriptional regulator C-terminal domain-containing protein, partial [Mesorhizobium sp.]|nr:TetR family transcriptional regulator C-terminal domain-containing protein [Mesorhizobium sp.]
DEKLARIQRVIHARMRSNLLSGLSGRPSAAVAEEIVLGVTALIDGLWLRLGLQPGSVSREQAIRQVKDYIAGRLALRRTEVAPALA